MPHLEDIHIYNTYITAAKKDSEYEYLTVYLLAKMIDYQMNETTGVIVHGDRSTHWTLRYTMKFMRSAGMQTGKTSSGNLSCPHCGAPLKDGATAVCPYCGSTITQGHHDWVLCEFMTVNKDTKDEGVNWS